MSGVRHYLFLATITVLGSMGLFSTDIYLPALPEMADYFQCTQSEILSSFTVFLLGLAGCQLVAGALADHFGRRRISLFGIILFTIATLGCAFAHTLPQFILFRLLQAMGGGVGSVICRVTVADRYDKKEAVKVFSTIFPIIGLSAAIGPFIGGYLTYFFNWRANFYFMAIFGVLIFMMVLLYLPEARQVKQQIERTKFKLPSLKMFSDYGAVLRNLGFLSNVFILCAGFCAFRCYSVESPFVFDNQGFVAEEIGHFYILISVAYLAGNMLAKRLVSRVSVETVLGVGFLFFGLGGVAMVLSAWLFGHHPYAVILPMGVVVFGNGFLFPTGSAGALAAVPSAFSGMASGLMGAFQFVAAALCITWVGKLCEGEALSLSLFIFAIIVLGLFNFLLILWRSKRAAYDNLNTETEV